MRSPGHSGGCRLCRWHLPDLSALFAQRQLFQAGVKTPMGKTGPTPLRKIDITWHDCSFLFRALAWFWVTGWTHGDNDGEREWKTAMNEDVSPIKNGDFPMSLLVFTRVPFWLVEQMRGVGCAGWVWQGQPIVRRSQLANHRDHEECKGGPILVLNGVINPIIL